MPQVRPGFGRGSRRPVMARCQWSWPIRPGLPVLSSVQALVMRSVSSQLVVGGRRRLPMPQVAGCWKWRGCQSGIGAQRRADLVVWGWNFQDIIGSGVFGYASGVGGIAVWLFRVGRPTGGADEGRSARMPHTYRRPGAAVWGGAVGSSQTSGQVMLVKFGRLDGYWRCHWLW